ncbi:hypothetical protein A3J19_01815 [Candidatus Daviesbacteria bacterium RIFCSPLOWO2_02_FULL_41_8]|uniref:Type II secretion system protein GspG C-terminal domain-containing protein n=3 Tax=Candidatus Daviesiibacteriota TaxID=1752718 RepID=A0A1F5NHM8_9BACT|nr:MAG: hypothetical protein A2871_00930 [Candidatus Daviesbacteria bacterium RIFCSPHIGHO2_01_FULL_41_23]OGE32962.1 MAG: hypothetical protein A3D83_04835 [Candidatus Daviesbacteria bacterium RIFCSPHIGHO2_02_FULL_41_10]OGE62458.1 MAG: hypothetical protein A2967_01415 [Candidatus Daviesbacteria bacterium RIFCSPLOWO2_01_FULL_41_32]OGE77196.1 MAG: hypothetical protein A3J19_01815 [Candidatus Daviesbacteria bacterium RIFCSPLOWO2_02_FULL_41_8]
MPKSRGFTLIELLVVISIIAILSVISFAVYTKALQSSRDAKRKTDLYHIQEALEQYYIKTGGYPLGAAGSDRDCWKNNDTNVGQCPLRVLVDNELLKSVPIDPGTNYDGGDTCGQAQMYIYISTNGVDYTEDGTSDKGYRLGAIQETQGTGGCLNADSSEKCPMWWGLQQYCLTNKQ